MTPDLHEPTHRRYDEPPERKVREVDAAERAFRTKRLMWAIAVFALASAALIAVSAMGGSAPPWYAFVGAGVAAAFVYVLTGAVVAGGAGVMGKIHAPSGNTTPRRAEYSKAKSLVLRGRFDDAIIAYEVHITEEPLEPAPYLEIARLYRTELKDPDEAVLWYRRARSDAKLSDGQQMFVAQELVDLYVHALHTPRRAIPELALLARQFGHLPAGQVAQRQLEGMRALLAKESEGSADFTALFEESQAPDPPDPDAPDRG